ncbi:MAG: aconitase X, partial [Fervidicoccaceae archaeon]
MYLTKEEERMLSGEAGPAIELAMRAIVKVGEAMKAERLVEVAHAHVSGISYMNIGEPGRAFIEKLA